LWSAAEAVHAPSCGERTRAKPWLALLALVFALAASPTQAADAGVDRITERTLGEATAPVTIYEFSSFTCPHCASFHVETLPKIKAEFIDSGKVKLVFRDFPLDRLSLAASVVARCVKPAQYFPFVELLFKDQMVWAKAQDPLAELKTRARIAGMGEDQVNACLGDQALIASLQQRRDAASKEFGIDSTPTFVIGTQTLRGAQPYEAFRIAIESALAKAG
jgi:protein-disulfide isomerase